MKRTGVHVRVLIGTFCVLLCLSCSKEPVDTCQELTSIIDKDPRAAATQAMRHGDFSPLSLGGVVPEVPGHPLGVRSARELPGTGDVSTAACRVLRPRAKRYATEYNATLNHRGGHLN